jgi:hypothetical protein
MAWITDSALGRTLSAAFGELIVAGLWGYVDAEFVSQNAFWFVAIGMSGLLLAWFWDQILEFRRWKSGEQPQLCPITTSDDIYADMDRVHVHDGRTIDDVYSVCLCLLVKNSSVNGKTLRNLSVRLIIAINDQQIQLPIRDSSHGRTDLRHGEDAIVEIGRVTYKPPLGALPAMPRPHGVQTLKEDSFSHIQNGYDTHRSLLIGKVGGQKQIGIGEVPGQHTLPFSVVISADDVVSKSIRMTTNLYAQEPSHWIKFLDQ